MSNFSECGYPQISPRQFYSSSCRYFHSWLAPFLFKNTHPDPFYYIQAPMTRTSPRWDTARRSFAARPAAGSNCAKWIAASWLRFNEATLSTNCCLAWPGLTAEAIHFHPKPMSQYASDTLPKKKTILFQHRPSPSLARDPPTMSCF